MKRFCMLLACLCLLCPAALADHWTGAVTAADIREVVSPGSGTLADFALTEGQTVAAGERAGELRAEKVFASVSGTATRLAAQAGEKVDGTVLEIAPISRYTVVCTVDSVAATPENALIRMGEIVWMKCTNDGSHRATGRVVSISGEEFGVETTAGTLYVGETVYLYRDAACTAANRVGKGTVTVHDTESVTAQGTITRMRVRKGAAVEIGQWLFSVAPCDEPTITVPADGVVIAVYAAAGDTVREDQALAEIAGASALRITVSPDESLRFTVGSEWYYVRGDDPHAACHPCTVSRVLLGTDSAEVELLPEEALPIGLTVTVTDEAGE